MSAKAITEVDGKRILAKWLLQSVPEVQAADGHPISFVPSTKLARVEITASQSAHLPYKPAAEVVPETITAQTKVESKDIFAQLNSAFDQVERGEPWVLTERLVVKPDQLIKRRGKLGLLGLNLTWEDVKKWISERAGKEITASFKMILSSDRSEFAS